MRRAFSALFAILLVSCISFSQGANESSTSANVPSVTASLLVSAKSKTGPILELDSAAIEIKEDGKRVQVLQVRRVPDSPVHYCVLFDTSNSEQRDFSRHQAVAGEFLRQAVRKGVDHGWLAFFDLRIRQSNETDDPEVIARTIASARPGGPTALYDSVVGCAKRMRQGNPAQFQVMFLFSDGDDNGSGSNLYEAVEAALQANVRIYSIGPHGNPEWHGLATLRKLADNTGGRAFLPIDKKEVQQNAAEMRDDLRGLFLVTYSSESARPYDQPRLIDVACKAKGIKLLAPKRIYVSAAARADQAVPSRPLTPAPTPP